MKLIQTQQNETVLEGFYPEQFDLTVSSSIYSTFVGQKLPNDKLFVLLGSDSGLLIDYLASIATAGQRFICVDFPEVIEHVQQTRKALWQENDAFKLELYTFEQFEFEQLYENQQDYVIRNATVLLRSFVVVQNKPPYKDIYEKYNEMFHCFRIDRADNRDFKKAFDQQLESGCDLQHPLSVIKEQLKGEVPAVLLGGGPSLDQVIPWLKVNQQKIWIFAASRICKRLIKEGITPDFIGVFDGQALIFDYSKEMYAFEKKSILITGEHPYAPLIRQWSGLKMYSRRRFPWLRGGEENFVSDGPTVTNALFGIGCYLGVSQFYLAGVDFCFTVDGVCHESGSMEAKNQQHDASDTKAINYRGEEVNTNIQLYDARNLFEAQLLKLKHEWTDLKVFNLNDGAAVMKGIEYLPLEQVVLSKPKFNVVKKFNPALRCDAKTEKSFQMFLKGKINSHTKWLLKIFKESKKGIHLSSVLFSDPSKQSIRIKEVLKLKTKLEKSVGADYQTFVNYGYQQFMETLKPVESESDMSQQEMKNSLRGFFSGLNTAAEGFMLKLEALKQEITFRLLELAPETDFLILAKQWQKNHIPGRFHVWIEHYAPHPYEYYVQHYADQVLQLERDFDLMKRDESALEKSFKQRSEVPEVFVSRLNRAFEIKKLEAVKTISLQLSLVDMGDHVRDYELVKALAIGMARELKGEDENALLHYLSVDRHHKHCFIQQQVYPLAFSLEQPHHGLKALNALSLIDFRYFPKYAEALDILGDPDSAIAAYRAYPLLLEDTDAVISLIRLLVQAQNVEVANVFLEKAEASNRINQVKLQSFIDELNG